MSCVTTFANLVYSIPGQRNACRPGDPELTDQNKDDAPDVISHDILLDRNSVDRDLEVLYWIVVKKASDAVIYYQGCKKWKRFWARFIRFFAVTLFSVAGLIPLLDATGLFDGAPLVVPGSTNPDEVRQIVEQSLAAGIDSGQIALLFAAVAAALIGMDKFFGLSSSWTRFISAELSLQRSLDRFQLDWALVFRSKQRIPNRRI